MTSGKFFLILLIFYLFNASGITQEQEYFRKGTKTIIDYYTRFDVYTMDEGLSNNTVRVIYQDRFGYMWFGTEDGLNKFDGYEFTIFRNQPHDSSSLSNNYINDITEDKNGNLWVATNNGLNKLNRNKGNFERYLAIDSIENGLKNNHIKALLPDSSGNLWVDTFDGYLHQFQVDSNSWESYHYSSNAISRYPFYGIIKDNEGMWILTGSSTAFFDPYTHLFTYLKDKQITYEETNGRKGMADGHTSIIKDKFGNYYMGNMHGYGTLYFPQNGIVRSLGLPSMYAMIKDPKNNIWFGGYRSGLGCYNTKTNTVTQYNHDDNNTNSIPNDQVYSIYSDQRGNIWVGTANGLAKTNPNTAHFKHIKHIANNTKTISSNNVLDVIQTKDSNIWVASYAGIDGFNLKNNNFQHYEHDKGEPKSLLSNQARALFEDSKGVIWIGLWSGLGFDQFDSKTRTFKHYASNSDEGTSGDDWYTGFIEDKNDRFFPVQWTGTPLNEFDRNKEAFSNLVYAFPSINNQAKTDIIYYFKNKLWFNDFRHYDLAKGTTCKHLNNKIKTLPSLARIFQDSRYYSFSDYFEDEKTSDIIASNELLYFGTNHGLLMYAESQNKIIRVTKNEYNITRLSHSTDKDHLWIGTTNGILLIDNKNGEEKWSAGTIDPKGLLKNQMITALLLDLQNQLWIGTPMGLYKLENQLLVNGEFKLVKIQSELCSDYITDLALNDDGSLWIATNDGLNLLSKNKETKTFQKRNSKLSNNYIHDLYIDKHGDLWIATQEGLNLYNPITNDFQTWNYDVMNPNSLSNNQVFKIMENDQNELFLGTGLGVCKIDLKTKVVTRYDEAEEYNINGALYTCALVDAENQIWVGTDNYGNSVSRINQKTGKVKHYIDRPYDSTSYKGNTANFIFEDSRNTIWIGTNKGLNKFNSKKGTFKLYTTNDGMPNNNVVDMQEDDHGNYWISTYDGLVHFNEETNTFKTYQKEDGVAFNKFNERSSTKLFSGELIFGGDKGLILFHPDSLNADAEAPQLHFTRCVIVDSLLFNDLSEIKEIQLDYTQNNFTIEFSVLDYINPKKNKYAYKLDGYDKDWINTDYKDRKAKYTELPYGTYTLQVKATNQDGMWMNQPISIIVDISPPWWKTIVAITFYVLLLILLILLFSNYRIRLIKLRNKQLEELVKVRTQEINEKNESIHHEKIAKILKQAELDAANQRINGQEEERRRISRELHDGIGGSLMGIKLYLENMIDKMFSPELNTILLDIEKSYREIRTISHDLIPPEFENTSVKEAITAYVNQLIDRSNINICLVIHPTIGWNDIEEKLQIEIYRIIQELLLNAIKHAKSTEIELQLIRHQNYINIIIEDDGIGMELKKPKEGIGLHNIEDRILKLMGKLLIDTKKGRGTIVNIEIPIEIKDKD